MTAPHWTLEELAYHWADAYLISYTRDRWVALRRDTRQFLTANTLDQLETAIEADYRHHPVPREFDPPDHTDNDEDPGEDTVIIVQALRHAFPLWDISHSSALRTWTARARKTTICENSAALLAIALVLIERKQRQISRGPGRNWSRGKGGDDER